MHEEIEALYARLNDLFRSDRERLEADIREFERRAAESHLLYGGKPLGVAFFPFILTEAQVQYIGRVVEGLMQLMEKVTRLFLDEPAVKRFYDFRPEQLDLIETDPGYERAIPCSRFDSFFYGNTLQFSELNTDGAAGMDGAEKVAKLFLSAPSMREFFSPHRVKTFDISERVLEVLLDCYREFAGSAASRTPRIAIVDWKEVRTSEEFVGFAEFCRERGYEAVVADPRELEYDGRVLSHRGLPIDIIYRRVVSREYVERLAEVTAMTRAFKDHNVCVVGSFRSDIGFNKKTFALLHEPEFARFFTEDERSLIAEHIPWTHKFGDKECEFRGRRMDMAELARKQKDGFVLKPSSLYESRGVGVGAYMDQAEWEHLIEIALKDDYVMQEVMPVPSMRMTLWDEEGLNVEKRFIHLGEYVFGGRFSGFYCRAVEAPTITRNSRERLVPCLVVPGT